jgi:vancomycin resistance protein YoaR
MDNKNERNEELIHEKRGSVKVSKRAGVSIWFLAIASILVIAAILVSQLLYDNGVISSNKFYENTSINGFDVSGMDKNEVANMISAKLLSDKEGVSIKLTYKDKEWDFKGDDFNTNPDVFPVVEQAFEKGRTGPIATRISTVRNIKTNGYSANISYRYILGGFDEKIDSIIDEVNSEPIEPIVVFNPEAKEMFKLENGINGVCVDKDELYKKIDEAFLTSKNITVEIPVEEKACQSSGEDLIKNTKLRSSFSTNYASSDAGRKNNVKRALAFFNGMVIIPGQEVSFNEATGEKTAENGYQKAKVILNGVYVEGYGGGACQSSTTLYNALILSDLEILEVNPHSLPVSYVPLAFDAMVSEGYSDLRFKNNLEYPIYIKTWGDDTNAYVNIYGKPFEEGFEVKRKADFIGVLPHEGDTIIKDEKGEYSDKITYAGEYLRIKYPQEGYHSKAYLSYYENGNLVGEKLIRDEIYSPQKGIIVEGTEILGEGMMLPENDVKFIPPQKKTNINNGAVDKKIENQNPAQYNP